VHADLHLVVGLLVHGLDAVAVVEGHLRVVLVLKRGYKAKHKGVKRVWMKHKLRDEQPL
jgi:hypothetical protein